MKITLRHVQFEPESCGGHQPYTALLVINAKPVGHVRGHQAKDEPMQFKPLGALGAEIRANHSRYVDADAWCRDTLPPWTYDGITGPATLESHVEAMLIAHAELVSLESLMQTHALVARLDVPGVLPVKTRLPPLSREMLAALRTRFPGATILNTKPPSEAYSLFRRAEEAAVEASAEIRRDLHDWKGFGRASAAL